jgi:hypothetical protein
MKFVRVCVLAVIALAVFSTVSRAQVLTTGAQGCRVSTVDRTITFCAPGEGGTITNQFRPFVFITDSRPYVWCIYEDGIEAFPCEPGPLNLGWTSLFSLGEGWHRFSVVVFDSAGVFKNWLRFRVDGDPECTVPTTDRTIFICTPLAGANVTSPVHIAAVANSTSVLATVMIAYVDGQQVQVAQDAAESGVSSQHGTTISTYLPLPLGTHRVSVQVVDQNNNKFATPEQTFTVVAAPQQD